jgi:transcriptional regulator GlxA family with amidase domain
VIDEITGTHSTRLRLPELAAGVGLSVRRLEQLFIEETGLTYIAFRRGLRMRYAEKLLRDSAAEVRKVTAAVGYKATPYFCREFKKTKGCTATEFRKRQQKSSRRRERSE